MATSQDHGSQLNFEQLHDEAAKLDHESLKTAAAKMTAPGAAAALNIPQICDIYKKVKPFLAIIIRIPLIPGSIKTAITTFMGAMDLLCP